MSLPLKSDPSPNAFEGQIALADRTLHHGQRLQNPVMSYRLIGPDHAPIVLAIGGISGTKRVSFEDQGWWFNVVGDGKALDTRRFRVLGIDYLGGSGDSTTTRDGECFPTISAYDQAAAIAEVIAQLGLGPIHAAVGASYGGAVVLALAKNHPACAERFVVLSVAERPHPHSSAVRAVEREIVRFGIQNQCGEEGLKLARALAMCTYRTKQEFSQRFTGSAEFKNDRWQLPVEGYIFSRGDAYIKTYRPEGFLALSESIDLFEIDATQIEVPVQVIAVPEDELVPFADSQALCARLPSASLHVLPSSYGHDAFLKEGQKLKALFETCLK